MIRSLSCLIDMNIALRFVNQQKRMFPSIFSTLNEQTILASSSSFFLWTRDVSSCCASYSFLIIPPPPLLECIPGAPGQVEGRPSHGSWIPTGPPSSVPRTWRSWTTWTQKPTRAGQVSGATGKLCYALTSKEKQGNFTDITELIQHTPGK